MIILTAGVQGVADFLGSGGELEEIVDGADQGPFASDVFEAAQEKLSKAAGLLDLTDTGSTICLRSR